MEFIRLVQVSDIHLLERTSGEILGVNTDKAFKAVIADATSARISPDILIATGDLSDDGSKNAYSRLKTVFTELAIPVFVLPGNHDSIDNMKEHLVNRSIKMAPHFEMGGWLIICLNSQVEGQDYGFINPKELSRLEETLTVINNKPSLVALHHSPMSECVSAGCQLQNNRIFIDTIAKFKNVKAVVAGHTHCSLEKKKSGIQFFTTPSTFLHATHPKANNSKHPEEMMDSHSFNGEIRGYRIIDLYSDGELKTEVRWVPIEPQLN